MQCEGAGGVPPASLFEITLDGANGMDFYDVSLVDGYNLPMRVTAIGGTGNCGSPGCTSDLNAVCPKEQQVSLLQCILNPLNIRFVSEMRHIEVLDTK
jgi:hypothetical protein